MMPDELLYTDFEEAVRIFADGSLYTKAKISVVSFYFTTIYNINHYLILGINSLLVMLVFYFSSNRSGREFTKESFVLSCLFLLPSVSLYAGSYLRDLYIFLLIVILVMNYDDFVRKRSFILPGLVLSLLFLRLELGIMLVSSLLLIGVAKKIGLRVLFGFFLFGISLLPLSDFFLDFYRSFVLRFEGVENFEGGYFLLRSDLNGFYFKSIVNWILFFSPSLIHWPESIADYYFLLGSFLRFLLVISALLVLFIKKRFNNLEMLCGLMLIFSYFYSLPMYEVSSASRFSFPFLPFMLPFIRHIKFSARSYKRNVL